ncbi:LPS export ABC transporter permease LptF [Luteimonas sp. SX5]|uniref:Lipopolysaccharide export system permease protein LptF n=1 Tax=Luteimonas galliterrae TaxID=2940486 RepID=A0ABT0MIB0_9GAMM|nr:LPS export ABC transporter permease LptF [Luteimonas galliterrae]MCL1634601.1 LPS export ABC transporter permease LptF [Luteimonas galliterrae]
MPKLDQYLFREFAQSVFAALVILMMVSLGGIFADVLGDIARGKLPAVMMLSQLGLQVIKWLPLILPLALMLGLLLSIGRLYRDSEMPVLAAIGVGPKRLLKPLLLAAAPVIAVIALCSLWLGPWADRFSHQMIEEANRSLLLVGLEPGRFTELPGGGGVVYLGSMSNDGSRFSRIFVYRQHEDRLDVTTAAHGGLSLLGERDRYLRLEDGFQVEGPLGEGLDYRMMRYASNELRMPDREDVRDDEDPELMPTTALFGDPRREAHAQVHWRIAPPLMALALMLLSLPLARSSPRQARYGRIAIGFLGYIVCVNLMMLGTQALTDGKIPMILGLWWLLLPVLALATWLYVRDGRFWQLRRKK